MPLVSIRKRNGQLVPFDAEKIRQAIHKAVINEQIGDDALVDATTAEVVTELESRYGGDIADGMATVEGIQDLVEHSLMRQGQYELAKRYILFRREQERKREREQYEYLEKFRNHTLQVTKSDGSQEAFDIKKVRRTYDLAADGDLKEFCPFKELESQIQNSVVDGMKTHEITGTLVKACIDLISVENIKWQVLAGRIKMMEVYKRASRNRKTAIDALYTPESYIRHCHEYVDTGLYFSEFFQHYDDADLRQASLRMKQERDFEYAYTTVTMLNKRYLLNPNKVTKELPQEMYMTVALFLAVPEPKETRLAYALDLYDAISGQEISLPTPTLMNARTNFYQLSSCFKISVGDDLRAIYHGVENMAQISKLGGGIGVYLGNVRSKGGSIRQHKGVAGGVTPWTKVINDTAVAVNQLGARAGAISVTLDVFHRDIYDFLDLQTETGDIRRKAFDVFPAIAVPDLFMKRCHEGGKWTLFDPAEIVKATGKKLQDHFGDAFEAFYEECEANPKLELKVVIEAKDLFKKFLKTAIETGMPYVFFRDTVNALNPNKHAGNVYSTQLCTEICQNMSPTEFVSETIENGEVVLRYKPGDLVVCNLASVNVAKVHTPEAIARVFPLAMRALDNVITLNYYPIEEARRTSVRYRSVGLGFLGLAEYLAVNKLAYDAPEARAHVDALFEKYALATLQSSNQLAAERGTYDLYQGSEWSKGILFGRDEKWYASNAQDPAAWKKLIADIRAKGVRFAYHLAPAPNTSTALVVGTTAALLPIYKKYFVENNMVAPSVMVAPNLSKENFWFYKEYVNMDMRDVIDMMAVVYKWIDQSASFEWMINPARVSPQEVYEYYFRAWKAGIKTVYYVRSMSGEVSDSCVSCSG